MHIVVLVAAALMLASASVALMGLQIFDIFVISSAVVGCVATMVVMGIGASAAALASMLVAPLAVSASTRVLATSETPASAAPSLAWWLA